MFKELKIDHISVERLLNLDKEYSYRLMLELISGKEFLGNIIKKAEINRPGLALSGFFDEFASDRIQILGRGEISYIKNLIETKHYDNLHLFFQKKIAACIITSGLDSPVEFCEIASQYGSCILKTYLSSNKLTEILNTILTDIFAPFIVLHGNFVSVFNLGILIIGESGVGKSESVLGLIERGHKFICDDMVKIKKLRNPKGYVLFGEPYVNHGPFMEIRGIGIIDLSKYFGEGYVMPFEKVDLVIKLHEWDKNYNYERLGLDSKHLNILGLDVSFKEIPVTSGRNITLLIEAAAKHELMKRSGYNPAEILNEKILTQMQKEKNE